eukprot:scaffold25495_cov30-Tisochrysis_lutea.AAC.7
MSARGSQIFPKAKVLAGRSSIRQFRAESSTRYRNYDRRDVVGVTRQRNQRHEGRQVSGSWEKTRDGGSGHPHMGEAGRTWAPT